MAQTAIIKNQIWNRETGETTYKEVTVKVGDWVGFKSDFEQSGKIIKIQKANNFTNDVEFILEDPNGFGGEYLRYATTTAVFASDCWTE